MTVRFRVRDPLDGDDEWELEFFYRGVRCYVLMSAGMPRASRGVRLEIFFPAETDMFGGRDSSPAVINAMSTVAGIGSVLGQAESMIDQWYDARGQS